MACSYYYSICRISVWYKQALIRTWTVVLIETQHQVTVCACTPNSEETTEQSRLTGYTCTGLSNMLFFEEYISHGFCTCVAKQSPVASDLQQRVPICLVFGSQFLQLLIVHSLHHIPPVIQLAHFSCLSSTLYMCLLHLPANKCNGSERTVYLAKKILCWAQSYLHTCCVLVRRLQADLA